ncbi:hypothetical protein [Anaerorhabdus furcosa]|uniref:Uncharacterized protein n=1 Tax=Anaerorhabdus furcosa TaxID=118967 RepID=A0A1T4MQL4_9FIRM|nr:hypothetical protein [Anaerorhabdus furcosa]SJZ69349.1 hypothetical protein SAMN02745191_1361 [Anaerorhabdus furcosa]
MKKIAKIIIILGTIILSVFAVLYFLSVNEVFNPFDVAYQLEFDGHDVKFGSTNQFIEMRVDGKLENAAISKDNQKVLFFYDDTPILTNGEVVQPYHVFEIDGWEGKRNVYLVDTNHQYYIDTNNYTLFINNENDSFEEFDTNRILSILAAFEEIDEPIDLSNFYNETQINFVIGMPILYFNMENHMFEETYHSFTLNQMNHVIILRYEYAQGTNNKVTWYKLTQDQEKEIVKLIEEIRES